MSRPATDAIELAWWEKGRARDLALRLCVRLSWLEDQWQLARKLRRIPQWHRPAGGFDYTTQEAWFAREFWRMACAMPGADDDGKAREFLKSVSELRRVA